MHKLDGLLDLEKDRNQKEAWKQRNNMLVCTCQIPRGWNGFAYVCAGSGRLCGTQGTREHALVFGPGDHVTATTNDDEGFRFLLVAGQPIGEPVVQYGPFVMNTQVWACAVSGVFMLLLFVLTCLGLITPAVCLICKSVTTHMDRSISCKYYAS